MRQTDIKTGKKKLLAIVSYCWDDWGGSEELWAKSIPYLHEDGWQVMILKDKINRNHPKYRQLSSMGVMLKDIKPKKSLLAKEITRYTNKVLKALRKLKIISNNNFLHSVFAKAILEKRPDMVVIAQGINFDGLADAYSCNLLKIPYVVIAQKAVDFYWPSATQRLYMVKALEGAEKCFFVSRHNHRLTEEQFGLRLNNSQVVYNPVRRLSQVVPFPSTDAGFRLACLARLFILDKGQDILLRIMAQEKWKARPLTISFIGTGHDEAGLRGMAALLGLQNVEFVGQVDDVDSLWQNYHAFILPSRSEGLPLSMVEAMAAGRTVIVTDAGGNAELVEEGITGFIGQANESSLDNAMEKAWHRRDDWENMGRLAAEYVSKNIPALPEAEFAKSLIKLSNA